MTVMPSSSDVADKAVSTEDASSGLVEVSRLEAVLAALVESKVEAMKADSSSSAGQRKAGSAPSSPRRPRLTSSSTVSSSQNHHHHHHHHHQQQQQRHDPQTKGHSGHRHHRRHGSAPCGDYIEDSVSHYRKQRHGKGKQKDGSEDRKRRRHSKSPHVLSRDIHMNLDPKLELLGVENEQDVALINFERTRGALSDSYEYPGLHRSACYISHSAAQLKSHYDEDYLAFNFADDVEEEETFSGPSGLGLAGVGAGLPLESSLERFHHRPRRKRKRRRRKTLVDVESIEVDLAVDPDELPPQARWTIVATACLLLAMSLLLVGVTLRMAPIIDEMVRKENEELLNSLNRDSSLPENGTSLLPP